MLDYIAIGICCTCMGIIPIRGGVKMNKENHISVAVCKDLFDTAEHWLIEKGMSKNEIDAVDILYALFKLGLIVKKKEG